MDTNQVNNRPQQGSSGDKSRDPQAVKNDRDFVGALDTPADEPEMYPTPADAAQELSGQEIDRGDVIAADGRAAAAWALRFIIIVAATALLFYLLRYVWFGLLPILLGLIICTVLWPPVRALRRVGLPSALAVFIVLVASFAIFGGVIAAMAPIVRDQGGALIVQAQAGFNELLRLTEENLRFIEAERVQEGVAQFTEFMRGQASNIASGVFSGLGAVASVGTTLVLTLILTFFFLKDGPRFLPWLRATAGGRPGLHATELLTRAWNTLSGFIRAQAIVSLVDAFFIGVGIWLVGVPMAFTLSVITFIAGFIPIVGAVVAGALAVLIALVSLGFTEAIIVLLIVLAVQQLEGNVLSPVLQSKAMDLHPVIVLVSVTIGGGLFGLVGAFLAVPVAAMIAVVFRYMMDVMKIHSGEKKADQLIFSTPEGLAIAELEEQESIYERKEWRGDRDWATTPVPAEELVSPPKGSQSWKVLRSSGELLQLAKPSELRRRFAARDEGSNT